MSTVRSQEGSLPSVERGINSFLYSLHASARYTGHFRQTVIAHPVDNGVMIKSVGALLVIGKLKQGLNRSCAQSLII